MIASTSLGVSKFDATRETCKNVRNAREYIGKAVVRFSLLAAELGGVV